VETVKRCIGGRMFHQINSKKWADKLVLGLVFLLFSLGTKVQSTHADNSKISSKISAEIHRILKSKKMDIEDTGLLVVDEAGQELVNINADKTFIPASISKIPTAMTAFETWDLSHQFTTQIWGEGVVKSGTLNGNLYLKGQGEPSLVSERMWYIVNAFARSGITRIKGDLVVDEGYFDSIRWDADRLPMSTDRAYDAPIGALSFNWNSVNIFVRPSKVGTAAEIIIDPPNSYILNVINRTKTSSKGGASLNASTEPVYKNNKFIGENVVVTGSISQTLSEKVLYRSISEPDLWAGYNFKEFLKSRNIIVDGDVIRGRTPSKATLYFDEGGLFLRDIVGGMMKYSNNFVAEMLTKGISVEAGSSPGKMSTGLVQIHKLMEKAGISAGSYSFVSPSGLSRKNKLSPSQFVKLLRYAMNQSHWAPEFLSSLPLSGVDGTLKSRMKGLSVRAKTGLLTGVSSLAGYITTPNNRQLVFTFIYNGSNSFPAREAFDQMCERLSRM